MHLLGSSANLHTPTYKVDDAMKTYAVPDSDLTVPSVVLGLMRIASMSGSTLPLGMPKPRSIPAAFKVATIRSALFMEIRSVEVGMRRFL